MFPKENYFFVKSKFEDLVLSCDGEEKADGDESQLWAYDNGFLACKKSLLAYWDENQSWILMEILGDLKAESKLLQYNRKKTMAHNQRWGFRQGFIYASADPRLVLTAKPEESAVVVSLRVMEDNDPQQWTLEPYEDEPKAPEEEEQEVEEE
ncbi:hypothetical protein A0J61_05657 [Choanephora cucurbitarum]|uniref:Uncharacterized protein n=1 Tax=Choanephora cucurbitarum TaxID=101091 RepID=A0A1C7NB37_9FUNG|nr:hypothetical protein A0J61_05657 [Choanephora cucurbitarum]